MIRAARIAALAGGVSLASWSVASLPADSVSVPTSGATTPRETETVLARGEKTDAETLKILAHNLANANTIGFKACYVVAEAVDLKESGGTRHSIRIDFRPGELTDTGRELDWAISGRGFFQISDDRGNIRYTRRGDFALNANGSIVLSVAGREMILEPQITVPPDAVAISIDHEGVVEVEQPGQTARSQIGQLQLATFVNLDGLKEVGGGLYEETEASGPSTVDNPDVRGTGRIRQKQLEASNVDAEATIEQYRKTLKRLEQLRTLHTM